MGLFDIIEEATTCARCGEAIEVQIKERHPISWTDYRFRLGEQIPGVETHEYTAGGYGDCSCSPHDILELDVLMRNGAAVDVRVSNKRTEGE